MQHAVNLLQVLPALLFDFAEAVTFRAPRGVIPLQSVSVLPCVLTISVPTVIGEPCRKE